MNIFEQASKTGLRFSTAKGSITTEDLWDIPLTSVRGVSLDGIAKALNLYIRDDEEVSFVSVGKSNTSRATLAFDIVKHVIAVKLDENASKLEAATKKAQKARILEIIADKEDESLKGLDLEALKKLVE